MPEVFDIESGARYGHHLPNLFILDGGKGQLNILTTLKQRYPQMTELFKTVQFCALGKGEARHKSSIGKKSKKTDHIIGEKLYVWKE